MSDLLKLFESRQGDLSDEKYANQIGLTGSTLWRYKKGKSDINTAARRTLIRYYSRLNDEEMIGALLAYKTDGQLSQPQLIELGRLFLSSTKKSSNTLALVSAA